MRFLFKSSKLWCSIENDYESKPIIQTCKFIKNTAKNNGGAIANFTISNAIILNSFFLNNVAFDKGGALYNDYSNPNLINCTIFSNSAKFGAGLANNSGNLLIINSILWKNISFQSGNEIWGNGISLNYSCFSNSIGDIEGKLSQSNCISENPRFYINGMDFTLAGNSPCIDKGNDSSINLVFDIRGVGFPRKLNGTNGAIGRVDIGAYEYQYGTDPITLINDKIVEPIDPIRVFPNPFSNSPEVIFTLADDCEIELSLYNLSGMKVLDIANGKQTKGTHKLTINSDNLTSGTYNLILKSCGKSVVEKVVVVR